MFFLKELKPCNRTKYAYIFNCIVFNYFMHEFYFRLKLWLVVLLLYSLIISHYSLDLLEFIIYHLSKNFRIQLILTQLEDLTLIVLDLIYYYTLLFYSITFTIIIPFLFFIPSTCVL